MDINYKSDNTGSNTILHSAQLIANAFAKGLEDNNCLLILPVGLHQEIQTNIKDVEDLVEMIDNINNSIDNPSKEGSSDSILNVLNSDLQDAKDKCFVCKLEVPKIDFNVNLKASLGKLKAQIQLYKNLFNFEKLDLCQVSYAMKQTCIPDILRLIALMLMAYVAIMGLKKLSNLSIAAFIKGVLSTLLGKILGAVKITVNIGSTNIACIVNLLKEFALAVPTQNNIAARLDYENKLALGLLDLNDDGLNDSNLLKNHTIDNFYETLKYAGEDINTIETKLEKLESDINEAFDWVSKQIDSGMKEVNEYIKSLLSFKDFFECESSRSGMDIEDAISRVNNLIQILNLLSAVALSIAKKDAREKTCKSENRINDLSNEQIDNLQTKDIIEELSQKVTDLIESNENGLQFLIKEEPIEDGLPKIDLFDCSISDFIEAHTLPNIISVAKKQVEREQNRSRNTSNNGTDIYKNPNKNKYTSSESKTYILKKPTADQIDYINNLVNLISIPPTKEEQENSNEVNKPIIDDIKNPIGKKDSSNILEDYLTNRNNKSRDNTNLQCRSIEDVLDVLSTLKR